MKNHLLLACLLCWIAQATEDRLEYGVDVSFPVHHRVSTNYAWLPHNVNPSQEIPVAYEYQPLQPLGNRQSEYIRHLHGCREYHADKPNSCDAHEYFRMQMNLQQPQSMKNYTETGYQVTRAPDHVVDLLQDFWRRNHSKGKEEVFYQGSSYINFWETPTHLVSVDDKGLRGSGAKLKEELWAAASATLEAWTEQELQPVSMYGIRVYGPGAIMLPHVDRLPLVASAIVNVGEDLDEPWPIELYDHSGIARNVTIEPGEMLLFESHSLIHGHPFPLQGRYQALLFMHFEPTGHTLLRTATGYHTVDRQYRQAVAVGQGGPDHDRLPPYLQPASPAAEDWRKRNPDGWSPPTPILPPEAHVAAKSGKLEELERELGKNKANVLTAQDANGWQVLHQGVAGGNHQVVKLLVDSGADINARTFGGHGESPLRIGEKLWGAGHPIVNYLKSIGALSLGPEL